MNKSKSFFERLSTRISVGILVVLAVISGVCVLFFSKIGFPCVFHELTHLYCPGCGATRACRALLRLDILSALDYNIVFVLSLPFIAYYLLAVLLKYIFGKRLIPYPKTFNPIFAYILIGTYSLFFVLRNIPLQPFLWLAP